MKEIRILGIYVDNRLAEIRHLQEILSRYGCIIRTRLGLHDTDGLPDETGSTGGLIILEITGDHKEMLHLESDLRKIKGLQVDKMMFITGPDAC